MKKIEKENKKQKRERRRKKRESVKRKDEDSRMRAPSAVSMARAIAAEVW